MKFHSFLYELIIFSLVFLFCIVPPFFVNSEIIQNGMFTTWTFPWQQTGLFIFAIVLYYIVKRDFHFDYKKLFYSIFILACLFCVSLFIKGFSLLLNSNTKITSPKIILPKSFLSWIFCLLQFLFAATYEEVLYRFYFPDELLNILNKKFRNKKLCLIFSEISGMVVFAFAHFYLGWLSVVNAAFAHFILRKGYKKTDNILCGIIAHFFYNIISLILL